MAKQKLEIECPVCDAKLSIDARSCPKCGADLGMADFQDLENLANDISEGRDHSEAPPEKDVADEMEPEPETIKEEVVATPKDEPKPEVMQPKKESEPKTEESPSMVPQKDELKEEAKAEEEDGLDEKGKKKGLFSKLFGKKK
ncbi:MAG TPA: zinc ribbon domain-containing protein [Methanomassiliicoccales archaeon]|jgi:outer membrane biosynthesis protein TonB